MQINITRQELNIRLNALRAFQNKIVTPIEDDFFSRPIRLPRRKKALVKRLNSPPLQFEQNGTFTRYERYKVNLTKKAEEKIVKEEKEKSVSKEENLVGKSVVSLEKKKNKEDKKNGKNFKSRKKNNGNIHHLCIPSVILFWHFICFIGPNIVLFTLGVYCFLFCFKLPKTTLIISFLIIALYGISFSMVR